MRSRLVSALPALAIFVLLARRPQAQQAPAEAPSRPASSPARPAVLDPGAVADGIYRNPLFGFSCKIPFGWVDRTQEMREDSPSNSAQAQVLLSVFERPPEAASEDIDPTVLITVESVASYSGLKTAADYFNPLTELIAKKGFKVVNQPYDFSVGAGQVVRGDFSKDRGEQTVHQSTLVMLTKGYIVAFTFIAESADDVDSLIANLRLRPSAKATNSGPKK